MIKLTIKWDIELICLLKLDNNFKFSKVKRNKINL